MRAAAAGILLWIGMTGQPSAGAEVSSSMPSANEPVLLSLQDAIRIALERNMDLGLERRNPAIRRSELVIEAARFDPSLRLGVKGGKTIRPSADAIDVAILAGAVSPIESTGLQYDLGIDQRLSSGGNYTLAWDVTRQGGTSTLFDPDFGSGLSLTFTQPLLKDFGPAVNRTDFILAQNKVESASAALEQAATDLVARVEASYWDLVSLRKNHHVELEKRRAAEELLAAIRAKVEQGLLAAVEALVAEAAVAEREEGVLTAEKNVRDTEDQLRQIMNLSERPPSPSPPIIPTDEPTVVPMEIGLNEAIETALDRRRDLRQARLELKNQEQRMIRTRNQTLPALNLEGAVGLSGLGATYGDDLDRLGSRDFYNWEAGVVLTLPMGNRAARSADLKQRMETEQAALNLKKLEQEVVLQLREAVRRLETDRLRIAATGKSRALAEKKLEIETERLRVGLTTTRNVLEFQKDLAEARSKEIQAITDYNKSQSRLAQVQGTLLRDRGIVIGSGAVE